MTTLYELLATPEIDMKGVRDHLDSLPADRRVKEVRSIGLRGQRKLFRAAEGFAKVDLDYFVPAAAGAGKYVRHFGKNSLPAFTTFEKRFARPVAGAREFWGYNHNDPVVMTAVGPGHFVLRPADTEGEVLMDYYRVPPVTLEGGPQVRSNTFGLSFFVYGNMVDVVRGVSEHVTIGRAIKRGNPTENYFLLCREEL